MKKLTIIISIIYILLLFSSCFSPWQGNEAILTINLGSSNGRNVINPLSQRIIDGLEHKIEIVVDSAERTITLPPGVLSADVNLAPGAYEITIVSKWSEVFYSIGEDKNVNVEQGINNSVSITMERIIPEDGIQKKIEVHNIDTTDYIYDKIGRAHV